MADLRTGPLSGQAAVSSLLRHPSLLACHSGAAFEGSEKPSQGHEKVRQKLVHVMKDISRISPTDYLSRQEISSMLG
jgi:hypothetical protein